MRRRLAHAAAAFARLDARTLVAAGLLLCAGLILLERLHTYHEPLERDIAGYAVAAHELLGGRCLYSDLWSHRPPAVYWAFALAESLFGCGVHTVFLLGLAAASWTAGSRRPGCEPPRLP